MKDSSESLCSKNAGNKICARRAEKRTFFKCMQVTPEVNRTSRPTQVGARHQLNLIKLFSRRWEFLDLDSILDEFVLLDRNGDGFLSWDDLKRRRVERNKFYKMVSEIKIKVPTPNKCPENTDAWTERGCLGLLTGGRPRLRARPEDSDFPAAIEVVEILMYLEKKPHFLKHIVTLH